METPIEQAVAILRRNQFKITKQLALQQVDKVQSAVTNHHCQHPSLRQLFKQIRSHH